MGSRSVPILIPAADAGMFPKVNRFKIPANALAEAKGVTFENDAIEKELGLDTIDADGIGDQGIADGSLSVASKWAGTLTTYSGGTAPAFVKEIDLDESPAAARTTFDLDIPVAGVAAGNDVIVNLGGKDVDPSIITIADDQSNTYTLAASEMVETQETDGQFGIFDSGSAQWAVVGSSYVRAADAANSAVASMSSQKFAGTGSTGFTAQLGATIPSGSLVIVTIVQENVGSGKATITTQWPLGGSALTEAGQQDNGTIRTHQLYFENSPAMAISTFWNVTFSVAVDYSVTVAWIPSGGTYVSGSTKTRQANQANGAIATWVHTPKTTTYYSVGMQGQSFDLTVDSSFTELSEFDGAHGNFRTWDLARHQSFLGIGTWYSAAVTALSSGEDITPTATEDCFMYGSAIELTDLDAAPLDVTDTGENETAETTPSVGPSSSINTVPQIAVGAFIIGDKQADTTWTAGTSYTNRSVPNDTVSDTQIAVETRTYTSIPLIYAIHSWESDAPVRRSAPTTIQNLTGTSATTKGSATVTGTGTSYTTECRENDFLSINQETRRIQSITNNTTLVTTETWLTTNGATTARRIAGRKIIIATTAGFLYKEEDGDLDAVTVASGLSEATRWGHFTSAGRETTSANAKLFFCNGVDAIQVIEADEGTAGGAISSPNTDWATNNQPVGTVVHTQGLAQRLVAYGPRENPHTLYFSDDDDHEDFTVANADTYRILVVSSIGKRIFNAVSFNGILYVWKWPRGIMYLDDSDIDRNNWAIRVKSGALGCAPSPHAALAMDDDVLFMAQDGSFHLLSAVSTLGGTRASDLSYALGITQWIKDNVNTSRLDQIQSLWDPETKTAYWGVPSIGQTTNDLTLKFDFGKIVEGGPVRFSYSERDNPEAMATTIDLTLGREIRIFGETGQVYLDRNATRAKNGVGYVAEFHTADSDLGDFDPQFRNRKKSFDALEVLFDPVAAGDVDIDVYVDGVKRGSTLNFDATTKRKRRTLRVGEGYNIQLRGSNNTVNENFRVLGFILWVRLTGEDQR